MAHLRKAAAWAAVQLVVQGVAASAALGWSPSDAPPCPGDAVIPRDAPSRGQTAGAAVGLALGAPMKVAGSAGATLSLTFDRR